MSAESSWSDKLWFSFQRIGSVKGEAQACCHGWGMFPASPPSKKWVREECSNKGWWKGSEASGAQLIMSRYVKLSCCKDVSHCQLSLLMLSLLYMWLVSQLVNKQICKPWLRLKAKGEPAESTWICRPLPLCDLSTALITLDTCLPSRLFLISRSLPSSMRPASPPELLQEPCLVGSSLVLPPPPSTPSTLVPPRIVLTPAVLVSPGSLWDTKFLRPHPTLTESESAFLTRAAGDSYALYSLRSTNINCS